MVSRVPVDMSVVLDLTRDHGHAVEFVGFLSHIHRQVHDNLQTLYAKYKATADRYRRDVQFNGGGMVWAVLTKEHFSVGHYNKLKAHKID